MAKKKKGLNLILILLPLLIIVKIMLTIGQYTIFQDKKK